MPTNSVLLEINTQGVLELIKILDLLKENNVSFHIIEEPQKTTPTVGYIDRLEKRGINHLLGKNGLRILGLLSEGRTYSEIAEETDISIDGVRYYIKKIFRVLKVNNGRDAVRIYLTELQ